MATNRVRTPQIYTAGRPPVKAEQGKGSFQRNAQGKEENVNAADE